jgi:hypothetical protein
VWRCGLMFGVICWFWAADGNYFEVWFFVGSSPIVGTKSGEDQIGIRLILLFEGYRPEIA